jgi:hypothetical protein
MAQHKTFRLYGCGGAGTNLVKAHQTSTDQIVGPSVAYLDTSLSNLGPDNRDRAYLIDGLDGGGMKRDLNADAMRKHVSPALTQYAPADFNVVVFSGAGGTGSVFGPLLLNELVVREKPVVAAVIGDTDSAKAIENTLGTLKTLSRIAATHKTGVAVLYTEMAPGANRREVDEKIQEGIRAIGQLTSGLNAELDTQDLIHWLHYERVTSHPPGLAILNIYNSNEKLSELHGALSVASLYGSPDDPAGVVHTSYRVKGYTNLPGANPAHFVLTQDGLNAVVEGLERKLAEHKSHADTMSKQHVTLHSAIGEDGDVLEF